MKIKFTIALALFSMCAFAQQQQQGADLAASFPSLVEGSQDFDLPEDGQWWDRNDSGWGLALEVQSRYDCSSGFFIFVTVYSFNDDGDPMWLAGGTCYLPSEPYQWKDNVHFSNMPWGHNDEPVMADFTIPLGTFKNGTSFGNPNSGINEMTSTNQTRFVFSSPSSVTIYPDGGEPHELTRFSWRDDSINPTLGWIKDYSWHIISSVATYGEVNSSVMLKQVFNQNASVRFADLDIDQHPDVKNFVGHQASFKYYISNIKLSLKVVAYFDEDNALADRFAPYVNGVASNKTYVVLVHDPASNHMSLYTVAGEPTPGDLRPDAGLGIKFRADINPDADVVDFYPLRCEGDRQGCPQTYYENDLFHNATFSEQNIHRSVMKMFKIRTGDKAFMYQPNTGESDSQAEDRIKSLLIEEDIL